MMWLVYVLANFVSLILLFVFCYCLCMWGTPRRAGLRALLRPLLLPCLPAGVTGMVPPLAFTIIPMYTCLDEAQGELLQMRLYYYANIENTLFVFSVFHFSQLVCYNARFKLILAQPVLNRIVTHLSKPLVVILPFGHIILNPHFHANPCNLS